MYKNYFKSPLFVLVLLLTFIIASCNSQVTESSSVQTKNIEKGGISNTPRKDSILQFSLMITSIFEDSKGNFWFGTHGDGLCRFDPTLSKNPYTYFTAGHGLPSGVDREFAPGPDWSITKLINGGNQISQIQEDKKGNIWFKNGENKVIKYDGKTFSIIPPSETRSITTHPIPGPGANQDYLWFSSWNKLMVYRYDGNQLDLLTFPPAYDFSRDGVSEIYQDNDGNMWFGTMGNGTFRYDGKSFTNIIPKDETGICRSVFQDNSGRVWISNNGIGFYYYEAAKLTNFTKEQSLKNNNSQSDEFDEFDEIDSAQSIEQDKNGDLWVGSFSGGLWRYDGKETTHFTKDGSLPIITVKTIYKDRKGTLWFGIGEGSVYSFNGKSFDRFDGQESLN